MKINQPELLLPSSEGTGPLPELPLTPLLITTAQVWDQLSSQQQQLVRQTLIRVCQTLTNKIAKTEEANYDRHDETSFGERTS